MTEQLFIKDMIELIWKEDQPGRQLGGQEGSTQEDVTLHPKSFCGGKGEHTLYVKTSISFGLAKSF